MNIYHEIYMFDLMTNSTRNCVYIFYFLSNIHVPITVCSVNWCHDSHVTRDKCQQNIVLFDLFDSAFLCISTSLQKA